MHAAKPSVPAMPSAAPPSDGADVADDAPVSGVVELTACSLVSRAQNDATTRQLLEDRVRPSERRLAIALAERFARRFLR